MERRNVLNQIILVGRVVEVPQIKETSNGIKYTSLVLDVTRGYKNAEGDYDSDLIACTLWRGVAEQCIDSCKEGTLVGVKGRLQANVFTNADGKSYTNYEVVCEKFSYLSVN